MKINYLTCQQVRQWGEIQARSRKISYSDFLSLAERKKEELVDILRGLEEGGAPLTREGIAQMAETLQEGAMWFPGGSKEMRVCVCVCGELVEPAIVCSRRRYRVEALQVGAMWFPRWTRLVVLLYGVYAMIAVSLSTATSIASQLPSHWVTCLQYRNRV